MCCQRICLLTYFEVHNNSTANENVFNLLPMVNSIYINNQCHIYLRIGAVCAFTTFNYVHGTLNRLV